MLPIFFSASYTYLISSALWTGVQFTSYLRNVTATVGQNATFSLSLTVPDGAPTVFVYFSSTYSGGDDVSCT